MFDARPAAPAVRARLERDDAPQVRLAAIDVLARLEPAASLAMLEPFALSDDSDSARAAIRALRHVESPAVHVLLDALSRAPEEWRRLEAVAALGRRGGLDAVATLQWAAASDESQAVVAAAIDGLAVMAARDERAGRDATRALVALTAERSRRETAIAALAGLPIARAQDVAGGLAHGSVAVRRAVVDALSRMRHVDATRWIEHALDDPAPDVRAAAVGELRRLGSRRAERRLVMLAQSDPDPAVRQAALMAGTRSLE
jgi:hypothetical protein